MVYTECPRSIEWGILLLEKRAISIPYFLEKCAFFILKTKKNVQINAMFFRKNVLLIYRR